MFLCVRACVRGGAVGIGSAVRITCGPHSGHLGTVSSQNIAWLHVRVRHPTWLGGAMGRATFGEDTPLTWHIRWRTMRPWTGWDSGQRPRLHGMGAVRAEGVRCVCVLGRVCAGQLRDGRDVSVRRIMLQPADEALCEGDEDEDEEEVCSLMGSI